MKQLHTYWMHGEAPSNVASGYSCDFNDLWLRKVVKVIQQSDANLGKKGNASARRLKLEGCGFKSRCCEIFADV